MKNVFLCEFFVVEITVYLIFVRAVGYSSRMILALIGSNDVFFATTGAFWHLQKDCAKCCVSTFILCLNILGVHT